MAGRFTFSVVLVSCLLAGRSASGQEVPAWGTSLGGGEFAPDPAQFTPSPYYADPAYCPPGAVGAEAAHGLGPARFGHAFWETVQQSWIRAEWLQWEIEGPGNKLMGAPIDGVDDPRQIFRVFDFSVPPQPLAGAFVPDLSPITFKDTNGVRGTLGIPLEFGEFEASAFWLQRAEDSVFFGPTGPVDTELLGFPQNTFPPIVTAVPVVPALTLLENGEISNLTLLYNAGLTISYDSQIWGAEAVLVGNQFPFELAAPERGITLRPIIGFRYVDVDERLFHVGAFRSNIDPTAPLLISTIESETDNDLYGGVFGARLQFEHRWFTIGAEPRVTLGANNFSAHVTTNDLRSFADPLITTAEDRTIFSPVLDFKAYARLHLHENFSLHVGYDVLWFARITRPHENILFNDTGLTSQPPGVVLDTQIEELMLEGLSVGGEIRFR